MLRVDWLSQAAVVMVSLWPRWPGWSVSFGQVRSGHRSLLIPQTDTRCEFWSFVCEEDSGGLIRCRETHRSPVSCSKLPIFGWPMATSDVLTAPALLL
jgi:hypothetical protein